MNRITLSKGLAITLALMVLFSAGMGAAFLPRLRAQSITQASPLPDLQSLLDYPHDVQIQDLEGAAAEQAIAMLIGKPEAVQLRMALAEAGYIIDLGNAQAMQVTVDDGLGGQRILDVAVVPTLVGQRLFLPLMMRNYPATIAVHLAPAEWRQENIQQSSPQDAVAYLVAMLPRDGTQGFFQAHKTNLDPALALVPDPPVLVNDMYYFYITTLHVVNGRIIYWHYWWYESNNHPNWYYAYYLHYWDYYLYGPYDWPWWYHWAYGWYYWRFWNYWSAWFPW